MKKLQLLNNLIKRTPKFSGCGYNAIPKNMKELEQIRGSFNKVNGLRKEELTYQQNMVKYYTKKYPNLDSK